MKPILRRSSAHIILMIITFQLMLLSQPALSQNEPMGGKPGIFEGHGDVGEKVKPGDAIYIPEAGQYMISGAGYNTWFDHDEFHYAWKRLKGDFILYARAGFDKEKGVEAHRKLGWMIRSSLKGNSPQVSVVLHGDGLTSLQFRKRTGDSTGELRSAITHADVLQLERKGTTYTIRVANYGEPFKTERVVVPDLGDEVYAGLFVCSHNPDVVEKGVFSDVRITVPYPGESGSNTPMVLGSNLEVLDIATGHREILYHTPYSIQAPNWTRDGLSLLFNDSKGTMYRFDIASRTPVPLNTGAITHNNNDHVLSFDGSMLGLSSNVEALGGSIIYTVPVTGGNPRQITPKGPSYLHGWSPDGKYLVFCGERNGEFDVYKIPAGGGEEQRLTNTKGLDDGPEYSPDGRHIYFNSVRSGSMQIWRMRPDGSHQEQVTKDSFYNWFAHISPDGKWIVFLSFLKEETPAGIHPPYKHVYIRIMPAGGGETKVLTYLYGGQGSINTPSWSPDSKRIAFISNSKMDR